MLPPDLYIQDGCFHQTYTFKMDASTRPIHSRWMLPPDLYIQEGCIQNYTFKITRLIYSISVFPFPPPRKNLFVPPYLTWKIYLSLPASLEKSVFPSLPPWKNLFFPLSLPGKICLSLPASMEKSVCPFLPPWKNLFVPSSLPGKISNINISKTINLNGSVFSDYLNTHKLFRLLKIFGLLSTDM